MRLIIKIFWLFFIFYTRLLQEFFFFRFNWIILYSFVWDASWKFFTKIGMYGGIPSTQEIFNKVLNFNFVLNTLFMRINIKSGKHREHILVLDLKITILRDWEKIHNPRSQEKFIGATGYEYWNNYKSSW